MSTSLDDLTHLSLLSAAQGTAEITIIIGFNETFVPKILQILYLLQVYSNILLDKFKMLLK